MDGVSRISLPTGHLAGQLPRPAAPPMAPASAPVLESFTPGQPAQTPLAVRPSPPTSLDPTPAVPPQVAPEKVSDTPPTFDRNRIPLNFEEAQRYSQTPADSKEREMLLQTFHLQHPDAAWLARKVPKDLKTPQEYSYALERPWNELLEARRVAQLVAQGRQVLKLEGQGINAAEARAIQYLDQEMPVECEILAADLGKRGEKAAWMVAQARKPDPFDRGHDDHTIKKFSERWSQRAAALKLIAQLERQAPAEQSALSFSEARALHFLKRESPTQAEQLASLLHKRHPSDGWMADKLLKKPPSSYDEFSTHDFHRLENQAKEREQAYQVLADCQRSPQVPSAWNLTETEAKAYFLLRHDNAQAAESLSSILGQRGPATAWTLERFCLTGGSLSELKQDWDRLQSARKELATWGKAPFTQSQVEALSTLAALAPEEAERQREQLRPDQTGLAWMAGKVIRSSFSTSQPTLEELHNSWSSLERAAQALQSAGQWQSGSPLVSWGEVDALQTWRREPEPKHYDNIKDMLSCLKARHPDCSWFTNRLQESKEQTPESYQILLGEYEQLQQARQSATQFLKPGQTSLTLEDANTLLTLRRLGSEEECKRWTAALIQRGSQVQMAMSLLPDPKNQPSLSAEQFEAIEAKLKEHEGALKLHQTIVSTPQQPIPEGQVPISKQEVEALFQLQSSCWSLAHFMRQSLLPRSEFIREIPSITSEWKGDLSSNLAKQHDVWMLKNAAKRLQNDPRESREVKQSHFHLGAYELEQPLGLSQPSQAENFVRVWCRLRGLSAKPEQIAALASLPGSERISTGDLQAIFGHLQAGGSLDGLTAEQAPAAARAWEVKPDLPLEQALERGSWPLAERLNGGPGPFKRAEIVLSLSAEQFPLAVEFSQARSLRPQERIALFSGLRAAPNPGQALLQIKGAAFSEALQALKPLACASEGENRELTPYDYRTQGRHGWEERGAAALALTFRGSWKQWLDAQARIRGDDGEPLRSAHDVVDILPLREAPGLDAFLLKHSQQKLPELSQIIGRWDEIKESERSLPFDEVLTLARLRVYSHMEDPKFGAEAAKWGIAQEVYPELEARFLASQQVPSPFAGLTDLRWKSGDFSGRFLPRDDVRGLFLGHHTHCCQHPSGAGASSAFHGQESPRGGFFVLENSKGEIVAQSWAWVADGGGLVFDNVEGITASNRPNEVSAIYQQAADQLVEQFPRISLGTEHSKLPVSGWPKTTPQVMADFDGYSDADQQVLLKSKA